MTSDKARHRITCPQCQARLSKKKAPSPKRRMRCPKCSGEFVPGPQGDTENKRRRKRSPSSTQTASSGEISWPWANLVKGHGFGPIILIGLFSIVTFVMLTTAIRDDRIGVRIFCLAFSVPASMIVYRVIISCFNKTTMTLDGEVLRFRHSPCPWFPRRSVSLAGVTSITTVKKFMSGAEFKNKRTQNFDYNVVAILQDGRQQIIMPCGRKQELAKRIQSFLTANIGDIESVSMKPDLLSVDPGMRSRVLKELDEESSSVAPVSTVAAEAKWQIDTVSGIWTAVKKWYAPYVGTMLIVMCGAMAIAVPPLLMAALKEHTAGAEIWVPVIVGGITLLAGLYTGIALLINRTQITWDSAELSIRHCPLPWPGTAAIATDQIAGIEVERKIRSNSNNYQEITDRDRPLGFQKIRSRRLYQYNFVVRVKLLDGRTIKVNTNYELEPAAALKIILTRQLQQLRGRSPRRRGGSTMS